MLNIAPKCSVVLNYYKGHQFHIRRVGIHPKLGIERGILQNKEHLPRTSGNYFLHSLIHNEKENCDVQQTETFVYHSQ